MKKSKRSRTAEAVPADSKKSPPEQPEPGKKKFTWWPAAAALGALFLAFEIYDPALHGAFVLDDRNLPFLTPGYERLPLLVWLGGSRPMLDFTFWLNFQASGIDPYSYHIVNVLLHFLTAVVVTLIAARLLEWAGVEKDGVARPALGAFAGALFLVHPLQTESVAYVASRSEVLSTLFYYGAYCVFLYRRTESITWVRALAVLALFGGAVLSKQTAITFPLLLVFTDLFWVKGGLRANRLLYAVMVLGGVGGLAFVWKTLATAGNTVLHVQGMSPFTYFLTQSRVVWTYVRLFFLPAGQNADPEVAVSQGLLDQGAIIALAAWVAVGTAAWIHRQRWPLASFGLGVFLLLLAPTSSVVPIADVLQERRLYLPFLGLTLVCLEFLRRFKLQQRLMVEVPVLLFLMFLTYQRSTIWGSPLALWGDTVAKSPHKVRPRFQLAFAHYEQGQCAEAADNYEIASRLAPPDYRLMVDWGTALDCAKRSGDAIHALQQATQLERDPQAWALIGQVYGKQKRSAEALEALDEAEKINPNFAMTYAVRGNVYQTLGNCRAAIGEFQHALFLNPAYQGLSEVLEKVQAQCQ
jgi:tetratricopeptide (TPR) repeat protein